MQDAKENNHLAMIMTDDKPVTDPPRPVRISAKVRRWFTVTLPRDVGAKKRSCE